MEGQMYCTLSYEGAEHLWMLVSGVGGMALESAPLDTEYIKKIHSFEIILKQCF